MDPPALRLPRPEAFAPLGEALAVLGIGVTLVDREMRILYANPLVREQAAELTCGADHCFAALWGKPHRCSDCLPLLVFRTGAPQEGVRERGRPGAAPEAWRVRAVPVRDAAGALAWVAESFVRLAGLSPELAGRASPSPETPGHALVVVDRQERIVSWSASAAVMFGHGVDEALGRRIDLIVPPDRLAEERALAEQVEREGRAPRLETVRRARDGREVPVALSAVALRDEAGALVGRTCALEDLSALQELRGRVAAQEHLLAHLTREAADAIVALDVSGEVTSWNRAAEQLFSLPASAVVGRSLAGIAAEPELARLLERVRGQQAVRGVRMRWRAGHGEELPVEVSAALLDRAGAPSGMVLVARDLSAQLRLDRQLIRSEKLALVGSLAAGLAHEIGTPLHVISMTAEYLMPDVPPPTQAQLQGIVDETERISRLVRDLLSFARGSPAGRGPVTVEELVERVLSLLRVTLEKRAVRCDVALDAALPPVRADPDALHQVLLNLLVNAASAVAPGGRVGVRARPATLDGGAAVELEVHDDGPGVPPELRERIFDPFFTTRPDGTGLGLAVCARIVAEHAGDLRVGVGPLGGAAFQVVLPVAPPGEAA